MWNEAKVNALNELLAGKRYGHPYTCPNRGDGRHHDNGNDLGCLVATPNGWVCPDCNYTQAFVLESSVNLPLASDVVSWLGPRASKAPHIVTALRGSWRVTHDVRVRMGLSTFTLPVGSMVAVHQVDVVGHKVQVEAGPGVQDWLHESWLADHCERAE